MAQGRKTKRNFCKALMNNADTALSLQEMYLGYMASHPWICIIKERRLRSRGNPKEFWCGLLAKTEQPGRHTNSSSVLGLETRHYIVLYDIFIRLLWSSPSYLLLEEVPQTSKISIAKHVSLVFQGKIKQYICLCSSYMTRCVQFEGSTQSILRTLDNRSMTATSCTSSRELLIYTVRYAISGPVTQNPDSFVGPPVR